MTHRRHRLTIAQATGAWRDRGDRRRHAGRRRLQGRTQARATPARALAVFPTELALPDGFLPEGIAIGAQPFAYFGSRADGDIYRVNLVTGEGSDVQRGPGHAVARHEGRSSRPALRGRRERRRRPGDRHASPASILASYAFGQRTDVRQRRGADAGRRLVHGLAAGVPLQGPARPARPPARSRRRRPAPARGRVRATWPGYECQRDRRDPRRTRRCSSSRRRPVCSSASIRRRETPRRSIWAERCSRPATGCSFPAARSSSCRTGSNQVAVVRARPRGHGGRDRRAPDRSALRRADHRGGLRQPALPAERALHDAADADDATYNAVAIPKP